MTKNRTDRNIQIFLFILIFISEMALGVYLAFYKDILLGDALSRTANSFYVWFIKPSRFASMGLVWNPLPSTLQLPFVALAGIWKPMAAKGVAGFIVSSAFAAFTAIVLYRTFLKFKISRSFSILIIILYSFHPYILFYGANGMSENISFCFSICTICSLSLWMRNGTSRHLIQIAFALVGLFFTRYESIPQGMALGLCIVLHILFSKDEEKFWKRGGRLEQYFYIEGTAILVFTPLLYSVLLWILYNWVITGSPLYFLNSGYSMHAYSAYYSDHGNWFGVLQYVWERVRPFTPIFFTILFLRAISKRLFKIDTLIFIISTTILAIFQYIIMMNGSSGGYVRYMCYTLPIAVGWIPYELAVCKEKWKKFEMWTLSIVLFASCIWFIYAFDRDEIIREDAMLIIPEGTYQMAEYINNNLEGETVLMDAYRGYGIILNINEVDHVITSSSEQFDEIVEDPVAYNVGYMVVPESGSYGDMDALNIAHPDLYTGGADWCTELASFGEYKLFKVND